MESRDIDQALDRQIRPKKRKRETRFARSLASAFFITAFVRLIPTLIELPAPAPNVFYVLLDGLIYLTSFLVLASGIFFFAEAIDTRKP